MILVQITFQEGPIKECGVNGVCNEDVIAMVIARLEGVPKKSEFACRENALAITKLEEALLWLQANNGRSLWSRRNASKVIDKYSFALRIMQIIERITIANNQTSTTPHKHRLTNRGINIELETNK